MSGLCAGASLFPWRLDLITDSSEVRVEGRSFHHLFRVRRLRVGDRIRLVDGRGLAVWSEVVRIDKRFAALAILESAPANEASVAVELYVATVRSARATWLVEKATEIGVRAIHFFHCERAPRSYGSGTLDRLARVARGAVEQSQRSFLPLVEGRLCMAFEMRKITTIDAAVWPL